MTKLLILLSLIFVPFVISPFSIMPIIPPINGGTRPPKELLALLFALAISLSAVYRGELKPFRNKWILIFLFYIPFSIYHSPPVVSLLGQVNLGGMWQWQPFCKILIYSFLIITVSSLEVTREELHKMFGVVSVVAVIMSLYVIVQYMNIDQFFLVKPYELIGNPKNAHLMGALGNSTLVSAFMVMCLPFTIYLKKWGRFGIIVVAVLLCESHMSTGAMIACLLIYGYISIYSFLGKINFYHQK